MTDSVHPTPDELSDLVEGLLDGADLDRVRTHVDACADCQEEVAAVDAVRSLLADAGQEPTPMPAAVADRLDTAIARAQTERAAGVPSLDERRERPTPAPTPVRRRGRSILIGGAAAAAVIVLGGVVVDGIGDLGTGGSDDSADAGSAASDEDSGGDAVMEPPEKESAEDQRPSPAEQDAERQLTERFYTFDNPGVPTLSPDNTGAYASELASAQAAKSARSTVPRACQPLAQQTDAAAALSRRSRVAEVRWEAGDKALLVVDPRRRTADVYGCGTDPQLLFTTSY